MRDPTTDTIVAISTAVGRGAIGIVRLSGPDALTIAETLAGRRPEPGRVRVVRFRDADGSTIDSGLLLGFAGPASATGEDVAELQAHGAPAALARLLGRALVLGARLARAGEFTERAWRHGKLDDVAVGAVADLLAATTGEAAAAAARTLGGEWSGRVESLAGHLLSVRARLEAQLDFAADLPGEAALVTADDLAALSAEAVALARCVRRGRRLLEGATVAIVGPPNAGKSTLFNALVGSARAITSPDPGTTRDTISETIDLGGMPVRLVDTAGLREAGDPVEQAGVVRARDAAAAADALLVVTSADTDERWDGVLVPQHGSALIHIRNKCDDGPAPLPTDPLHISAATGRGLDLLRERLLESLGLVETLPALALGEARAECLDTVTRALEEAVPALALGPECAAEHLAAARAALDTLLAPGSPEEVLGEIYGRYCLGK